ncbi:MAG: hypothetical protein WC890_03805 [Candidatus Margulisiibacteriota bacterium]
MDIHGLGAFGIIPFLSEDVLKQTRLANISTRAGKIAYIMSLGEKAKKPEIREGVHPARGALKWIAKVLDDEEENKK